MPGLGSLLWFVVVLAAIPATLWFLKRTPLGGAGAGAGLRSIAALPLSASQRIVTVEVGHGAERRWLVLGVTPQSISVLHTMEPESPAPDATAASFAAPPAFASVFERLRRGRSDA